MIDSGLYWAVFETHTDNTFLQKLMAGKQKNNSRGKMRGETENKQKPTAVTSKRCFAIKCTSYKCYFLSGYDLSKTGQQFYCED